MIKASTNFVKAAVAPKHCAIVNAGPGAWAFEEHAAHLASVLWVEVSAMPRRKNLLLSWESAWSINS